MTLHRPELAAFALAAVVVAGATVLAVTHNVIPSWFPIVAVGALTGGAGLAPSPNASAASSGTDTLDYVSSTVEAVQAAVEGVQGDVTALRRRSVVGPAVAPPAPTGEPAPAPPPAGPAPAPAPGSVL